MTERKFPDPRPSKFDDPIAQKTAWEPLTPGGTNLKSDALVQVESHRLEFKPTAHQRVFALLFALLGLVFMGIASNNWITGSFQNIEDVAPMLFPGAIFILAGIFVYRQISRPIVFDKSQGFFWKGRQDPGLMETPEDKDSQAMLSDIYAIQILAEHVTSSQHHSDHYSFELNLVLRNSCRINVIDHGDLESVRVDAESLAQFLGCPVWDATLE